LEESERAGGSDAGDRGPGRRIGGNAKGIRGLAEQLRERENMREKKMAEWIATKEKRKGTEEQTRRCKTGVKGFEMRLCIVPGMNYKRKK